MTQQVFEISVLKWLDTEGIEKQEIGKLVIRGEPTGTACQDFSFQVDENAHPMVPVPLRMRGRLDDSPVRASVWALVHGVLERALTRRAN